MVCEEHCPVPDKAIRFREAEAKTGNSEKVVVKQPYVESGLCIGCGICETKCPLAGPAAINVYRVDAVI
jgi:formate hydrogenlyase subunit 6/NADH:ubiquinone oxidoreductase subunit I